MSDGGDELDAMLGRAKAERAADMAATLRAAERVIDTLLLCGNPSPLTARLAEDVLAAIERLTKGAADER